MNRNATSTCLVLCSLVLGLVCTACGAAPQPTSVPAAPPTAAAPGGVVFDSSRGGDYRNLYVMDSDGGSVVRLTTDETDDLAGPWSPDGKRIAYTWFDLTTSDVWVMDADGTGQTDLTNSPQVDEGFPAWSPDGQRIAFTTLRDGNNEIYVMNADGSSPVRLTDNPADDFAPAWSPDGSRIAFVSDRDQHWAGEEDIQLRRGKGRNAQLHFGF